MSHQLVLYSYWRSSCSYRVRIALGLKGLSYEYKAIHLVKGEQNSPEFSVLSPNQTVPVLLVDGKPLYQSLAIMEWLDQAYPEIPLIPRDPWDAAKVRALAYIIACDIQPLQNLRVLKQNTSDGPSMAAYGRKVNEDGLTRFEQAIAVTAGRYCFGDEISLADICLVPQLYNARRFQVDLDRFPTILRVSKELELQEAFKNAHPSQQPDAEQPK
eukprot:TRINITY_DN477_c0_g1_i4.p1 TRINITY_DN477_c0_g1~~TRINITY_DN477_c0_g1_i4.p1  ORF type:complete len:214 (-),score=32.04 TRINITY_DN477_c0_g1_i4:76-717(-)